MFPASEGRKRSQQSNDGSNVVSCSSFFRRPSSMSSSPCFDPLEMFKKIHILFLLLVTFSLHFSSSSSSLLEPVTDDSSSKSTSSSSNGMARINDTSNVETAAKFVQQQQQDEGQLESFLYRPLLHVDKKEGRGKRNLNERKKLLFKRSHRGQHQPQVFNIGAVLSSGAHVKFLEQVKIFSILSLTHLFPFSLHSFIFEHFENIESNRHPINRLRLSLPLFCVSQLHVLPFSPSFLSFRNLSLIFFSLQLFLSFSLEHFITLEGKEIQRVSCCPTISSSFLSLSILHFSPLFHSFIIISFSSLPSSLSLARSLSPAHTTRSSVYCSTFFCRFEICFLSFENRGDEDDFFPFIHIRSILSFCFSIKDPLHFPSLLFSSRLPLTLPYSSSSLFSFILSFWFPSSKLSANKGRSI